MNSLADAAAQAAADAAAANATAPSVTSSAAVASTSATPARPESSSSKSDRHFSSHHSPGSRPDPPRTGSREAETSNSPTSQPSPDAADMIKSSGDTPVRRALLDTEKPEKRGSNLACLKCRAIKVKCSRANADDERCKRCNRLDLVCEFKEHHRGRKPKKRPRSEADSMGADEEDQLEDDEAEAASFSAKATTSPIRVKAKEFSRSPPPPPTPPTAHHQQTYKKTEAGRYEAGDPAPKLPSPKGSVHGRWFGPYLQPIPSFEDSLFPRKHPSQAMAPHSQHQQQQLNEQSQKCQSNQHLHRPYSHHHDRSRELPPLPISSVSASNRNGLSPNDHGQWDRTSAWSSAQSNIQHTHPGSITSSSSATPPTMATDLRQDAVYQHAITMDQAHELFGYFYSELNPPLALLDASLHTLEYCHQNSPILFSTILSVASRFFQPQLHRQCHRIAKSILNLAAAEEICTLDHIQALILVITWKDPGDRTILRKAIRAIGYAYELGLHSSFEGIEATEAERARDGSTGNRARSESSSPRYKRRLDRDRQRTWIVLCLIHELVRRDDRNSKPRARIIPIEDYPDPYIWIKSGGDVLLSVDSRLAWSLDMSILTLECEPFLELINQSENGSAFSGFFDRYRGRLDMLRKRYFDVQDGVFHPRFPMDKSAVAELPYVDGHRDFFICQSTWQWAAKVATQRRTTRSELNEQQDSARSSFWFSQTVESAMRCLRLFIEDLCKPGYVRIGHDYLVITLSEIAKWFFLYRDHLEPSTVVTGVEHLRAVLRECSQPQRLASGEVVDTEREAPGYLMRFIGAIFDAGLNQSYEKAKRRLAANVERFRSKPSHWAPDAYSSGASSVGGRDRSQSSTRPDDHAAHRREHEVGQSNAGAAARRPTWTGGHSLYPPAGGERQAGSMSSAGSPQFRDVASATARYSTAPSLPRGRTDLAQNRVPAQSPSATTSYERGGANADKSLTSPTNFHAQDSSMAAPSSSNFASTSSVAPHPAYLASPGPGSSLNQPLSSTQNASWSNNVNNVAPSWSSNPSMSNANNSNNNSNNFTGNNSRGNLAMQTSSGLAGLPSSGADWSASTMASDAGAQPRMDAYAPVSAANVVPLAADIGKNSIEGLAACLTSRDLTYWQDILGFDLGTPAV